MMGMKETVSNIVTSQAEKGGVKHVYYVACGVLSGESIFRKRSESVDCRSV